MEVRVVRFDLREFLEFLEVSKDFEEKNYRVERFFEVYKTSNSTVKDQMISYILNSDFYKTGGVIDGFLSLVLSKISN